MKRKWYAWLLTVIVIVVIAACSSYNYSTSITNDSEDVESVEIYLFGILSDEFENMKMITYDDFWMKVFNSKGEYPANRKIFYFGPETTTKTLSLDYNDNAWSVWKDSDMKYLCVVAYSPDFTDSSRKDVWKKIIRLRHFNWWWSSNEKLNINLCNGVLDVKDD